MKLTTGTTRISANGHAEPIPDISRQELPRHLGTLDRVGMSEIQTRVLVTDEAGRQSAVPAKADAFVRLDRPTDKGIHMSRLYLALDEILMEEELTPATIRKILERFIQSHADQTSTAEVRIRYEHPVRRRALISDNAGWRVYPVTLGGLLTPEGILFDLETEILYSSACPCSAALARDLTQKKFLRTFPHETVSREQVATWLGRNEGMEGCPHSQRSKGTVQVRFNDAESFTGPVPLIDQLEESIQTVVQAAVKREDEQEFARLNAQNLMFCEDAARNMMHVVEKMPGVRDFRIEARHYESLHPHDAVSVVTKGVPDGYQP